MKTIPLTQGKVALVDDEDYEALSRFKWCASRGRSGKFYATRHGSRRPGPRRSMRMHTVIACTPAGMYTDHIDGDGLNNQRSNLRICTNAENLANRGKQLSNSAGFKGVSRYLKDKNNPWQAQIQKGGRRTHLGFFSTAEAAARAYDEAALKLHGEFAFLNFPLK